MTEYLGLHFWVSTSRYHAFVYRDVHGEHTISVAIIVVSSTDQAKLEQAGFHDE